MHPDLTRIGASFRPSSKYNGWVGVGFGMVFSILSFSGFEGAATLGEETINPRRNIPIALLGTVFGSGLFFVFVAYCEVVGFGPAGLKDLGALPAPLDDLALRYGSPRLAILLDLAAAVSCFSGIIGGLAAAARILFALGRAGLSPTLAYVHPVHRTPAVAVSITALLIFLPFLAWGPIVGGGNYYSYTSTIGVLALILIYIGVGAAETVEAWRERRPFWATVCTLGPILLLWVLYRNIYPVPEFPNNLWPYVAFVWVIASWALIRLRPASSARRCRATCRSANRAEHGGREGRRRRRGPEGVFTFSPLKGRIVIVTGSSKGIGRRIALRFAAAGCHVLVVSRRLNETRCSGRADPRRGRQRPGRRSGRDQARRHAGDGEGRARFVRRHRHPLRQRRRFFPPSSLTR